MRNRTAAIVILGTLLAGCATPAPAPTEAPTHAAAPPTTATTLPAETVAPTPTESPTSTPAPTPTTEPAVGPAPTTGVTATPTPYDFSSLGLPFNAGDVKLFKYCYRPIGDPCGFHAGDMIYVDTTFEDNPAPRNYEVLAPAEGQVVYATHVGTSTGWEVRILIGEDAQGPVFATLVHLDEVYKQTGDHVERAELIGVTNVWKDNGRKELLIDFSLRHHPTGLGPGSYDDPSGYFDPAPYLVDDFPPGVTFENEGPGYCQ